MNTSAHWRDSAVYDVVLFGFRNDLARARTLALIAQLPDAAPLRADTPLPQRLVAGLEPARARPLHAALERLGAQVALVPTGVAVTAETTAARAAAGSRPTAMRPLTALLLVLLGAAAWLWRFTPPPRPAANVTQQEPGDANGDIAVQIGQFATAQLAAVQRAIHPAAARLNGEAIALAEAGDFAGAADRLRDALRLASGEALLTRNLQNVLYNWGAADLAAEHFDEAVVHFQQAAELGERPDILRALGASYARRTEYALATAPLQRALQLEPADAQALLLLAQIYVKQERRPDALELLQRARDAGARVPELDAVMQQLSREVDAEWDFREAESRNFRVRYADGEDHTTVDVVLDALEDAYDAVGRKLGTYPQERTIAVLYSEQDFHAITRTPDWAGAVFDGRIKIPVRGLGADDPDLPRVIRHEYAHSVIAQVSGNACPVWLNEGIAMWAEENVDGEHERWAENIAAAHDPFSFEQLSRSFAMLPADRAELAYAQSYLAVRDLITRYGSYKIPRLLEAMGAQPSFRAAFAKAYPGDLEGFERQFLRSLGG